MVWTVSSRRSGAACRWAVGDLLHWVGLLTGTLHFAGHTTINTCSCLCLRPPCPAALAAPLHGRPPASLLSRALLTGTEHHPQELTAHELNKARLYVTDHDVMGLPPIRPTDQVGACYPNTAGCARPLASRGALVKLHLGLRSGSTAVVSKPLQQAECTFRCWCH